MAVEPTCDCGTCLTCRTRAANMKWRRKMGVKPPPVCHCGAQYRERKYKECPKCRKETARIKAEQEEARQKKATGKCPRCWFVGRLFVWREDKYGTLYKCPECEKVVSLVPVQAGASWK